MAKNYIDFKCTVWGRIHLLTDVDLNKVKDLLQATGNPGIVWEQEEEMAVETESLYETEEFITPEENDNQSTIELYKDGEMIWNNEINKT